MNLIKTQSYFPTIFDEFFKDNWNINLTNDNFVSPSYNIKENDKEFVIELAIPGKENTDFNIEIQKWYAKDRTNTIQQEMLDLIKLWSA